MAIKKILPLFLLLLSVPPLSGQWKTEIANYFGGEKDYQEAASFLIGQFEKIDDADRADVCALLAYAFSELSDQMNETRWMVKYFESYQGKDSGFLFLDISTQAAVMEFITSWKSRYPLLTEAAFISSRSDQILLAQGILPVGLEMANDAYYKLSSEEGVLKGGLFKAGFNLISLEIHNFLEKPGTHVFFLETKAGDVVVKREIDIEVEVHSPHLVQSAGVKNKDMEYNLSLYVNGELILTSKKIQKDIPLQLNVSPSKNPFGFKPDYYVTRNEPGKNFFSIFDAVGIIYGLLKELAKGKKAKEPEQPKIQMKQEIAVVYLRKDPFGIEQEIRATVKLRTKYLSFFSR